MRIIGGSHKGKVIKAPPGLPVRPTTDFAKEGLFNILNNLVDLEECVCLDLFSGTGHISLELASRGSKNVTAVDEHIRCVQFLQRMSEQLSFSIQSLKGDVFAFLESSKQQYDLIFADPPYDMPEIPRIHELVFGKDLLKPGGWLIIEHGPKQKLEGLTDFVRHRKYGNVNFSFFQKAVKK